MIRKSYTGGSSDHCWRASCMGDAKPNSLKSWSIERGFLTPESFVPCQNTLATEFPICPRKIKSKKPRRGLEKTGMKGCGKRGLLTIASSESRSTRPRFPASKYGPACQFSTKA